MAAHRRAESTVQANSCVEPIWPSSSADTGATRINDKANLGTSNAQCRADVRKTPAVGLAMGQFLVLRPALEQSPENDTRFEDTPKLVWLDALFPRSRSGLAKHEREREREARRAHQIGPNAQRCGPGHARRCRHAQPGLTSHSYPAHHNESRGVPSSATCA